MLNLALDLSLKEAKKLIELLTPVEELHHMVIHVSIGAEHLEKLVDARPVKVDTSKGEGWFVAIKELGDTLPLFYKNYEWIPMSKAPKWVVNLIKSLVDKAQKGIDFWASHSWGRGIRCHGYWQGQNRVGFIALSPRSQKPTIYHWSVDVPKENAYSGQCSTLREAKEQVEEKYKEGLKASLLND